MDIDRIFVQSGQITAVTNFPPSQLVLGISACLVNIRISNKYQSTWPYLLAIAFEAHQDDLKPLYLKHLAINVHNWPQ